MEGKSNTEKLYRIAVDNCIGPKDAREKGAVNHVDGNVLVVCVHEVLIGEVRTEVTYLAR